MTTRGRKPETIEAHGVEPVYRALGSRIEMLRNTMGWTQDDLAKRIGMSRASIANIEVGRQRIHLHTLQAIATSMLTTPKHLMKGIFW